MSRMNENLHVSCDVLVTCGFVGPFNELSFIEFGAGADECHEVGGVDGTPAGVCGFDELECHRDSGGP